MRVLLFCILICIAIVVPVAAFEVGSADYWENIDALSLHKDIRQGKIDIEARSNYYGLTPLMRAARHSKDIRIILTLIDAGSDVNAWDRHFWTPLMQAAAFNTNPQVISILIKAGAQIDAQDTENKTAYDYLLINEALQPSPEYEELLVLLQGN